MKKSICYPAIFLCIIIILTSCKENSTNPTIDTNVLIPLKIGNYWLGKYTDYDPLGYVVEAFNTSNYVAQDSVWNNEKIYRFGQSPNSFNSDAPFFLNRNDGYYIYNIYGGDTVPNLFLKYPANEGDFFICEGDTMWVEKINVEYKVSAGKFKCYKYVEEYRTNDIIIRTIHYHAPGIGPIATETYYQDQDVDMYLDEKWELIKYNVK